MRLGKSSASCVSHRMGGGWAEQWRLRMGSSISLSALAPSRHVPRVLVSLLVAVMKYCNQSNQREQRLIWLKVPGYSSSLPRKQGVRNSKQPTGHIIATVRSSAGTECIPVLSSPSLHSYTIQDTLPSEWCQPQWRTGQPDLDSPSLRLLSRQL